MLSNGNATLMLENAITRACDTNNDSWIERFEKLTYDDLVDETGLSPSKAGKQLAKLYDDNAFSILEMWDEFVQYLDGYDNAKELLAKYNEAEITAAFDAYEKMSGRESDSEKQKIEQAYAKAAEQYNEVIEAAQKVAIYEKLEKWEYDSGTMLDFFTQPSEDIEDDITVIYPLVRALTDGQRAGLEFVSLKELVAMAITDANAYNSDSFKEWESVSIYAGVDRDIYKKGGVALTSDALRKGATEQSMTEDDSKIKAWTIAFFVTTGVMLAGSVAAATMALKARLLVIAMDSEAIPYTVETLNSAYRTSTICTRLAYCVPIIMIILIAWLSREMTAAEIAKYNISFTAIPRFMIDEKDLVGYNSKGEKIVLKNQSAYYKAVLCNRGENDEKYVEVGDVADLNGDVGKQWLALYAARNETQAPILADSLKVVLNSEEIPAGYTTGIHMFGSDAAENLNNTLYDWNSKAPKVYVYYKVDDSAASAAGSNFTAGSLALSGGAGFVLGAALSALGMKASRKRKENTTVTV